MQIKEFPEIFKAALPVLQKIEAAGYEAYFVGGAVRDLLLNRHIHDVDIATSAYPAEIKQIFDRTIDTGIKHGTVTVMYDDASYEVTTFRTESGYQDFRRPDHVTFVQSLSDDLKRRDFTINALAMNADGQIIDHFAGLQDLKYQTIRAVGNPEERFHEDALRMMRAVRFMSQLRFKIAPSTLQAIKDNHQLLKKISVERIRDEFVKMGLGKGSREAFQVFLETGMTEDVPGFAGKSKQLSVFSKLKYGPSIEANLWSLVVVLLKLPDQAIASFMRSWKNSNEMTHRVGEIVRFFDLVSQQAPTNYDLFATGLETVMSTIDLAHILGQPIDSAALVDRYQSLPIKQQRELAVNGSDLLEAGIPAGPSIGRYLHRILVAVLDGKVNNDKDSILTFLSGID
ncbi:MAG: CCA tRNA nucleotidyltransferase [Lactobacillus sp.]|jgi:tRNA nucleotidyltransferase (CCA-adding enzyme)|nr:CCA tRNA nucleotidyltransferase [Lactobacillus sp.]MCH3906405.1 CCA tRNA nucleotidyltransferase [Lactobacillus sp.]MCH3990020.1 CCA tRNA nucleotidyltransferase [Lactobacillus sp.]MCH4069266.1 CCA tRNA nucleotidyltransferase [Lactobacillus sp.]MCI1303568.1 CCA tRNA nucleotidyltransferase [Lactobacillus sp.]